MDQMARYGIPASITLAQGLLESARGSSQLFLRSNNMFGIKASASWLAGGGGYVLASDDRPNEKFCRYDSPADSMEHHSCFLKDNSRYAECFRLSPDDYRGWSEGLGRAGYASDPAYADKLRKIIESNGLAQYDAQVMAASRSSGSAETLYSFPVMCDDMLIVTQPFGVKRDALDPSQRVSSTSLTVRSNGKDALATENGARVLSVNRAAGSVTVALKTGAGDALHLTYSGLTGIEVAPGDILSAGQRLGGTGSSMSLALQTETPSGATRSLDPVWYLRQMAAKGGPSRELLYNGQDIMLPSPSTGQTVTDSRSLLEKLLHSSDYGVSGPGMENGSLLSMVISVFSAILALSSGSRGATDEQRLAEISKAVADRSVSIREFVPGSDDCRLTLRQNGEAHLEASSGSRSYDHCLTPPELIRVGNPLFNTALSDETRMEYSGKVCTSILLQDRLSQRFEQSMSQLRSNELSNEASLSR